MNDGGLFIDRWAKQAHALGWLTLDVFSVHPFAPAARFNYMGLVWLLDGNAIAGITASTCAIKHPSGHMLTFTRRPSEPGCVAVWQLGEAHP